MRKAGERTGGKGARMRFEGKCVVITGASSGMGRQIALDFAAEGATVIAVARRRERLEELAQAAAASGCAGKVLPYPGDVCSREVNESMIDFAVARCGKLDVLVNNAGVMDEYRPVAEISDEQWFHVMDTNLNGPMYATRKAVQTFLAQRSAGSIVNVVSIGGVRGCRAGAAYTASKHALIGLTENTAAMYQPKGIRVNAVCPGGIETEVMKTQKNPSAWGVTRVMTGTDTTIAPGKVGDVSSVVLFAASDDARYVTGATIVVDGGVSCY